MKNLEKQKELAKEAINLIKEFGKIAEIIRVDSLQSISTNTNGSIIVVEDTFTGRDEYALSNISDILRDELEGFGPCGSGFYIAIEEAKGEVEEDDNEDFIKSIENIDYVESRSEEIYERLKAIEKEAFKLNN